MAIERALHLPAKAKLSWHISRLVLDESGTSWVATASRGGRVAVISLPTTTDPSLEEAWLAEIEAAFEAHAFDPAQHEYPAAAR